MLEKMNKAYQKIRNIFFIPESTRANIVKKLENITPELLEVIDKKPISAEEKALLKAGAFSEDFKNIAKLDESKTVAQKTKKLVFNFFGMNDNWKIGRCLLGGFLVHAPEYPTYFIPAYTQAKATGEAKELKKGEGPRGIITGALEGVAVGALVSGNDIKKSEMVPYMILGAGLQLFSSKVFPWLGEKAGAYIYRQRMAKMSDAEKVLEKAKINKPEELKPAPKPNQTIPVFKNLYYSGSLKI